jgi:hypothetical protein
VVTGSAPIREAVGAGRPSRVAAATSPAGIWRVHGPDLLDMAEPDRRRITAAFAGWLDQLPTGLTLLVCSRPCPPPLSAPPVSDAVRSALSQARLEHLSSELCNSPAHCRSLYLVPEGKSADLGVRLAAELAVRCGLRTVPATRLPLLAEGLWREGSRSLQVGGRWTASLRLGQLPGVEVQPGWLWALLGIEADYDLALGIRPRSAVATDRHLRRRLRGLRAQELAGAGSGVGSDPRLVEAMAAADHLRKVLATGSGRVFEVRLTVSLAADTDSELAELSRQLRARMAALRGSLIPAWFDEVPARLETAAPSAAAGTTARLVDTEELATFWPWLDASSPVEVGQTLLGRHLRTRTLEGLDLRHHPDLVNANLGVVASSGSGKSYLAGLVGLEAVRMGLRVVVIDPENEHRSWVEATGGRYLDLAGEFGCGFNVLELGDREDAALGAVDLVNLLCGPLAPPESGSLMAALATMLEPGAVPRPVLGDCIGRLGADPAGRSLADRLRPWVQGRPGALFSRSGTGPAVDSVVGLGLRDLPPAWVPATTLLVSRWLWDWAKSEESPKQVIVDEAGLLADNPALQLLITHLARRIRKYQGSLMLLTQAAGDLVGGGAGEVVAINCATIMLGGQGPTGAHRLQRAFALDDGQRDWLQQAGRGRFLLVSGSRRSPIEVRAPALYHRLLTTRSGAAGELGQRTSGEGEILVQD